MARFSLGFRTGAPAANGFFFDLVAGAQRARVREIGLFNTAATIMALSMIRAGGLGTRTTPATLQANEPADAPPGTTLAVGWSVAPTVAATPAQPLRRIHVPAVIGAGFIWTFGPDDLVIPANGGLLFQAIAAGGISDGYCVVDE